MKNKSGFILNLIAMIYILFSGIGIGVSNKLPWWLMFLAIIGFIITTILGMIVSIKETKVLKYIVLVLAIVCLMIDTAGLFMFDFALFVLLQMCTLIPSILALIASIKNVK